MIASVLKQISESVSHSISLENMNVIKTDIFHVRRNNIDHNILLDGSNGEFRKYLIVSLCGRFKQLVVSQLQYRLHTKFALGKDVQGKTDQLLS